MKYLTFTLVFLSLLTLSPGAQEKPKASPTPIKPEISLTMTPAESEEFGKIQSEVNSIGVALNSALMEMKAAGLDDKLMRAPSYKAVLAFSNLLDAQTRFNSFMVTAQRAHACEGCLIDPKTYTFVKPAEAKK